MSNYHKNNNKLVIGVLFVVSLIALSCSPTRRLQKDQNLVTKVIIQNNKSHISSDEVKSFVKVKTNRKVLFNRFYLQVYNLVNKEKEAIKQEKRIEKRAIKNQKRKDKGKKEKNEEPGSFNQWLLSIGEPPMVYDQEMVRQSTKQIRYFFESKGYFNVTVTDSVAIGKNQKAKVFFILNHKKPYTIEHVTHKSEDAAIQKILTVIDDQSVIKPNQIYDRSKLNEERDRVVNILKDSGYFDINSTFISFRVDSGINFNQVDVNLDVNSLQKRVSGYKDSIEIIPHKKYKIKQIKYYTDYSYQQQVFKQQDSVIFDGNIIYYNDKLSYKPLILTTKTSFCRGDFYNQSLVEKTYQNLANLKEFRFINISFIPNESDSSNYSLDCIIQLTPLSKRAYKIETQGTNTQGNLGVAVDFSYQNKNLLKGFEIAEFKVFSSLEVQRILNESGELLIFPFLPFNTLQIGPELSLQFPKLWPLRTKNNCDKNKIIPITRLNLSLNYQKRPDYERSIFNVSQSYQWASSKKQISYVLDPILISYVRVNLSPSFEEQINNLNSIFYRASFSNQLILGIRFNANFSNQKKNNRNYHLIGFTGESSGFWAGMLNSVRPFIKNDAGLSTIYNVPYSQYFKFDIDYRKYLPINKNSDFAMRLFGGIGLPYNNSSFMPFVKSYSAGGANDMRAWIARDLGPGSFVLPPGIRYEQIGDIKLLGSFEYRYKFIRIVETAAFIDAGNIWIRRPDAARPGAEFEYKNFFKEIAVGAGVGVRLNFNYFIFRLDFAQPIRFPSKIDNSYWVIDKMQLNKTNINFGIGYPF